MATLRSSDAVEPTELSSMNEVNVAVEQQHSLRSYRLPNQPAYRQVAVQGKFVRGSSFSMRWIESPDGLCRFCFLAKKKNGNAVYRNRCRRLLRPLFYGMVPHIAKPVWAMVIVNDKANEVTSERFRDTAEKIFKKMEWSHGADNDVQNG